MMKKKSPGRAARRAVVSGLGVCLLVIAALPAFAETPASKNPILEAEQLLSGLGYWVLKADGVHDVSTYHAIMAFQKVEGLKRTGKLTPAVLERLRSATRPDPKFKNGLQHIEVDITRQVMFLVDDAGVVTKILPVSTGNETKYFDQGKWQIAHTPRGAYKITRQIKGVRTASLGNLYYPNYFVEGVAIHGSDSIPAKPASHGCVRIPRFSDKAFSNLVHVGMDVFVYD